MDSLIPYGRQYIDESDIEAVTKVLKSEFLTQGPAVEEFEQKLVELTGAKYCVVVANATAALHLSVAALGLEQGSHGITSPNTFLASANCMAYCGIRPDFADIDVRSYNIDPQEIEKIIDRSTRLLIPVHFAGQAANMPEIWKIAQKHGLYVIEDAAHAIGSSYADGSLVGCCKYSHMTVFSFHPVKTICTGEGGAICTNDVDLYKKIRRLRSHGITKEPQLLSRSPGPWYYEMIDLGYNFRLTDIQAALGTSQLKKLGEFKNRRQQIVSAYNRAFSDVFGITIPYNPDGLDTCFHLYAALFDFERIGLSRPELMKKLHERGIATQVHYIPVYLQPYYRIQWGYQEGYCPKAEDYYSRELSLPLFPAMSDSEVSRVVDGVLSILGGR